MSREGTIKRSRKPRRQTKNFGEGAFNNKRFQWKGERSGLRVVKLQANTYEVVTRLKRRGRQLELFEGQYVDAVSAWERNTRTSGKQELGPARRASKLKAASTLTEEPCTKKKGSMFDHRIRTMRQIGALGKGGKPSVTPGILYRGKKSPTKKPVKVLGKRWTVSVGLLKPQSERAKLPPSGPAQTNPGPKASAGRIRVEDITTGQDAGRRAKKAQETLCSIFQKVHWQHLGAALQVSTK